MNVMNLKKNRPLLHLGPWQYFVQPMSAAQSR